MKPAPPRLVDDPSFLAETGCDLADEAASLEAPRLPELRQRLMASLPAPAAPTPHPARWPWVGGGAVVLAVFWWFWQQPPSLPAEVPHAAVAADATRASHGPPPPAAVPQPPGAVAPPERLAAPVRPSPPASRVPSAVAPRGVDLAAPLKAEAAPASPATAPTRVAAPDPEAAAEAGDLARQLTAFEAGEDRFASGDHAGALVAYKAYLDRWPAGHFRAEAEIASLRATAALGDAAAAEAIAARLADDPALLTRRTEILTLRLSALVRLGRCDEALALAPLLPGASGKKTAAACR